MPNVLIYGIHAVMAALSNPHRQVKKLYVNEERADQRFHALLSQAQQQSIPVERLTNAALAQKCSGEVHQGVIAEVKPLPEYNEADIPRLLAACNVPLILILDGVTDPHNLGACLRTADAAGVDFVIIPKDKSATVNAVVSKVACGATESIPIVRVTNLARAINALKAEGVWVFGAAGEAETTLYSLDCRSAMGLIMGAEGSGLRRLTRELCDGLFHLPMQGIVSSLNVSVATGICLYEVVRQRNQ